MIIPENLNDENEAFVVTSPFANLTPQGKPNPALVEALLRAVSCNTWSPSDRRRMLESLSDTTLEGAFVRNGQHFWPPKELHAKPEAEENDWRIKNFYHDFATEVLGEAQRRIRADKLGETTQGLTSIQRLRTNYSVKANERHHYFDVETADPSLLLEENRDEVVSEQVVQLKARYMEVLKESLIETLSDARFIEDIRIKIAVQLAITAKIVLKETVERFRVIQEQVERPEEVEMILKMIKAVGEYLGNCEDCEVEELSIEEALTHGGCEGLYKPAYSNNMGQKVQARIAIPFYQYGTGRIRSLQDVLEIAAHEYAHHQMLNLAQRVREGEAFPDHGIHLGALVEENLRRLLTCRLKLTRTIQGTQVTLVPTTATSATPILDVMFEEPVHRVTQAKVSDPFNHPARRGWLQKLSDLAEGKR